jgi:outer membrane lipoprotein SlyB
LIGTAIFPGVGSLIGTFVGALAGGLAGAKLSMKLLKKLDARMAETKLKREQIKRDIEASQL